MFRARFGRTCAALTMLVGLLVSTATVCAEPVERSEDVAREEKEYEENVLAFFVGFAVEDRREGAAVGLEYEHRFTESFGLGALAEHTFADFDSTVYAVPFAYHSGHWKTYLAPGVEDGEEKSESLVRIGFEYGFEKGAWEISPQLDVDLVDSEEVYVIGVVFGRGL